MSVISLFAVVSCLAAALSQASSEVAVVSCLAAALSQAAMAYDQELYAHDWHWITLWVAVLEYEDGNDPLEVSYRHYNPVQQWEARVSLSLMHEYDALVNELQARAADPMTTFATRAEGEDLERVYSELRPPCTVLPWVAWYDPVELRHLRWLMHVMLRTMPVAVDEYNLSQMYKKQYLPPGGSRRVWALSKLKRLRLFNILFNKQSETVKLGHLEGYSEACESGELHFALSRSFAFDTFYGPARFAMPEVEWRFVRPAASVSQVAYGSQPVSSAQRDAAVQTGKE